MQPVLISNHPIPFLNKEGDEGGLFILFTRSLRRKYYLLKKYFFTRLAMSVRYWEVKKKGRSCERPSKKNANYGCCLEWTNFTRIDLHIKTLKRFDIDIAADYTEFR